MGTTILERLQHHSVWVNCQNYSTEELYQLQAHISAKTLPEESRKDPPSLKAGRTEDQGTGALKNYLLETNPLVFMWYGRKNKISYSLVCWWHILFIY